VALMQLVLNFFLFEVTAQESYLSSVGHSLTRCLAMVRGCCGHPKNKSPKGSSKMDAKIGGKINIFNKKN
jgi:hypothetical protein